MLVVEVSGQTLDGSGAGLAQAVRQGGAGSVADDRLWLGYCLLAVVAYHGYDEVYTGYFPDALADSGERFDLVTFNDVLEHVIDPAVLLTAAIERLHPSGWVLATIPNVRFLPVVLDLVRRDRWDYADWGVLDRTHLRFFTRSTMVELLESAGLVDVRAAGVNSVFGLSRFRRYRPLAGRIGSAEFMQYVVVGRRA